MSELGFENVFYLENFECTGEEVLVRCTSPQSPAPMAARLATPSQNGANNSSPVPEVRELIVIPEISDSIQLQHAMQQVSSSVVKVNGELDSSPQSSPSGDRHHTYITVSSEGTNGINYHVQYVEPQEIYTQPHQIETLRSYPVYGVEGVEGVEGVGGVEGCAVEEGGEWEEPPAPHHPRMPPATVQWLLDNYETADGVSLPRSTLYSHYLRHCSTHRLDPVNAASFGKLIRSVFVGLRTRRLGTRGNSKYHYYGIRAKPNAANSPVQDNNDTKNDTPSTQDEIVRDSSCAPVGISHVAHRNYLGAVTPPDPPPLLVSDLPEDIPHSALEAFRAHHRENGAEFLEAVAALDCNGVERVRRKLWTRPRGLCRRTLWRLGARPDVATWLREADLLLHQRAVALLLPDVLRPIPPHLTQTIRSFAKSLESSLSMGGSAAPQVARRSQEAAATGLANALRRYTSLNHLAQAAHAVLTNHHQIHQMLSDLNRVDFRVVREQAAWACSCANTTTANKLEADFKATLGRGASLEQWAGWLESCVESALSPHEGRPEYTARARRLLLDWSFYSSLVIRELTLRSAASFGSFHLLRLLYDEYVSYLIERRVAQHENKPPIAVMLTTQDDNPLEDESQEEMPQIDNEDDDPSWEWEDDEDDDDEIPHDGKRHKGN